MAITLPTFTIDDPALEARLLAAFDTDPELTAIQEYRRWYKAALIEEVKRREAALIAIAAGQEAETKRASAEAEFNAGL